MLTKKESLQNEVKESKISKARSSTKAPAAKTATKETGASSNKNKTTIVVKCDVGFHNQLYIRGNGAGLNWEKGQLLKNTKSNEWVWECNQNFENLEYKILINDKTYENGENHRVNSGATVTYTPHF